MWFSCQINSSWKDFLLSNKIYKDTSKLKFWSPMFSQKHCKMNWIIKKNLDSAITTDYWKSCFKRQFHFLKYHQYFNLDGNNHYSTWLYVCTNTCTPFSQNLRPRFIPKIICLFYVSMWYRKSFRPFEKILATSLSW